MLGSLYSGVSGLSVHQDMLNVVGDNLANLNTTGFKSQTVEFSDLLYQTLSPGTASSSSGVSGTNPTQVGSGVQVASIGTNQGQGSLTPTGGQLDLAIQGKGYFEVGTGNGNLFTRAGSFALDQNGYLTDPATGDRVQRYGTVGEGTAASPGFQKAGSNDIQIPMGTSIPGAATASVTLQGNLSASATGPAKEVQTTGSPFLSGGAPATAATTLNSLYSNTAPYAAGDSIVLQGTTSAGAAVNVTVPVGPTTTLGDLVNSINANFPGSTATISNGNVVVTDNNPGVSKLGLTISEKVGNAGGTAWSKNAFQSTTTGKAGDTLNSAIQVYDVQGNAHNLSLTFQKQANNTWNLTGKIPSADGTVVNGQVSGITFNDNGSFQNVTGNAQMTFQFNGLSAPQTVNLSLGTAGGFTGLTQFGGAGGAAATGQDGFAAGSLTSLSIGNDGTINGVFTNGRTLGIAQLAIASFANPDGLTRSGSNYFSQSAASGEPQVGAGDSGGRGAIRQGTLEGSNVDVSLEFTRLIIAQRGFEVNTRTISISDQILQDLTNILH